MSKPFQFQFASQALGLLALCALTMGSTARAEDCSDTPMAESCACQSPAGGASSKVKRRLASRHEAANAQKKAKHAAAKAPPVANR